MNDNPLDSIASNGAIPTPEQVLKAQDDAVKYSRTLASVPSLVPEEEDPSVLFRNNWLARGQVVSLVASTGVGKSSMTIQTAFHWALGKLFLAEPMRPLKCAIIQAEDSERDVAEQIEGMHKGLVASGWTEAEFKSACASILCPTHFIGLQGDAFIKALAEFQQATNCDMLFINPVQAFFGGDIADQQAVSHWARAGIDPILKSADHPCCAFLVMHTTKFTSGEDKGRANVDDYGEYIGAGSHEWNDWVRAKFVFLKHGKSDNYFDFKAAKRGKRLKWIAPNGMDTTNKVFKHADGYIFWIEVTDQNEIAEIGAGGTTNADPVAVAELIANDLKTNGAARISDFEERFRNFSNRITIRAAKNLVCEHPEKYRLTLREVLVGRKWTAFIGLSESVDKVSKEAQNMAEQKARIEEIKKAEEAKRKAKENEPDYTLPDDYRDNF